MQLYVTVPVSIGGDEPTFEGDVTFRVSYTRGRPETAPAYSHGGLPADPDEYEIREVLAVNGREGLAPDKAQELIDHVDGTDAFDEAVAQAVQEEYADAADWRAQSRRDRIMENGR